MKLIKIDVKNRKVSDSNSLSFIKLASKNKMKNLLEFIDRNSSNGKRMIKKAFSQDQQNLVNLFGKMLETLNITCNDPQTVLSNLSNGDISKFSSKQTTGDKHSELKIVSKHIKDSHYKVDVSKDEIVHKNKKVQMVSCYLMDSYIGQYLIKRNFFYLDDKLADQAYDQINAQMNNLRSKFYKGDFKTTSIFPQAKKILDGVLSEIEINEE
jgi:hypothetical protein